MRFKDGSGMQTIIRATPTPQQAELASFLGSPSLIRWMWNRKQAVHPYCEYLRYYGTIQMLPDRSDPYHFLSFPMALFWSKQLPCRQALVRVRCNNVMFFSQPT